MESKFIVTKTSDELVASEPPPEPENYAKMARWLVHNSEWTSMGTISTVPSIIGFPMVNVVAIADSDIDARSTGQVYFYLTMLDLTAKDLSKQNKLTALISMDQSLYCKQRHIDPMEPTCARVMFTGEALRIPKDSDEFAFGTAAMLSHHPASANWVATHDFFLCKLNITSIVVLDFYGGANFVKVDDYLKADLDSDAGRLKIF